MLKRAADVTAPTVIKAGEREGPREETSLLAFLSILLLHRRLIVLCGLIGTAIVGTITFSSAERYTSRASFVIRGSRSPVEVPGGAAALRAFVSASEFSQSVNFYSDLVKAKSVALPVAAKSYATSGGLQKSLAEVYGIDEPDQKRAIVLAADRLINDVSSSIYSRSGVVGLAVKSTDPLVAQQLARNIITELDAYGGRRRQEQAVEERAFIQQLGGEARARLDQSEEDLSAFLRNNREYNESPSLKLAFDRLSRRVFMLQQAYIATEAGYEQARIEEARDPAALNIVEPPDLPAQPERAAALRGTLLGLVGGFLVGIVIAFVKQRVAESRAESTSGYLRFSEALRV